MSAPPLAPAGACPFLTRNLDLRRPQFNPSKSCSIWLAGIQNGCQAGRDGRRFGGLDAERPVTPRVNPDVDEGAGGESAVLGGGDGERPGACAGAGVDRDAVPRGGVVVSLDRPLPDHLAVEFGEAREPARAGAVSPGSLKWLKASDTA